jgi:2-haloalkanoic acid dehalogenase type II
MTPNLRDYEALSFDCYGTLIDWETGIWGALQPLLESNDAVIARRDALQRFGELESEQEAAGPTLPYPEVLARVHADLASGWGLASNPDLDRDFGASVPRWPAFPDSPDALAALAGRYRLVILSNVHRAGFAASSRLLEVAFDAIYTAEDIGSYKPDPANFDYLIAHVAEDLGVGPGSLLHVAQSLYHDHAPAKAAGLDTVWIDRQRLSQGGDWGATLRLDQPPEPDHVFFSMEELARAVQGD